MNCVSALFFNLHKLNKALDREMQDSGKEVSCKKIIQ